MASGQSWTAAFAGRVTGFVAAGVAWAEELAAPSRINGLSSLPFDEMAGAGASGFWAILPGVAGAKKPARLFSDGHHEQASLHRPGRK